MEFILFRRQLLKSVPNWKSWCWEKRFRHCLTIVLMVVICRNFTWWQLIHLFVTRIRLRELGIFSMSALFTCLLGVNRFTGRRKDGETSCGLMNSDGFIGPLFGWLQRFVRFQILIHSLDVWTNGTLAAWRLRILFLWFAWAPFACLYYLAQGIVRSFCKQSRADSSYSFSVKGTFGRSVRSPNCCTPGLCYFYPVGTTSSSSKRLSGTRVARPQKYKECSCYVF